MRSRVRTAPRQGVHPGGHDPGGGPNQGSVIAPEVYEKARAAYLAHGTIGAVRDALGCSVAVATRLIDSGEPRLHLPSLKDAARVLAAQVEKKSLAVERASAQEQADNLALTLEARAKAARQARAHEGKVLGDAVASRGDEVRLVRANRQSALVLAAVNADLLRVASNLSSTLLQDKAALAKLSPREKLGLIRTVAGIVHRTAQTSQTAVNMERLLMGEPTAIVGRADGAPSTQDMTPEEAEQWFNLASRAFRRRAARRTTIDVEPVEAGAEETESVDELVEDLEQ